MEIVSGRFNVQLGVQRQKFGSTWSKNANLVHACEFDTIVTARKNFVALFHLNNDNEKEKQSKTVYDETVRDLEEVSFLTVCIVTSYFMYTV